MDTVLKTVAEDVSPHYAVLSYRYQSVSADPGMFSYGESLQLKQRISIIPSGS